MKIAINTSPLSSEHRIRGVGFYLKNLLAALKKYFPQHAYMEFTKNADIPNDADVIHYPYFDPFFLTIPFFWNKKMVVTVHDLTPLVLPQLFPVGIKGKIKWQIQKYILQKSALVITDSLQSKKDIELLAGIASDKIKSVYLAPAEHFRVIREKSILQNIQKKYSLPKEFVLYVGDATANKNLPNLVKAVLQTKSQLYMVGKTLADESIDVKNAWNKDIAVVRLLQKQNDKQIHFLGFVADEDLVAIYNMANALLMPSLYEGFGLPILEAFACGCPVVTSLMGSLPEVAGNAACFVDAKNIETIAYAIEKIVNDKTYAKKLSRLGLGQVKKFSWKKTAQETLLAYEKIL